MPPQAQVETFADMGRKPGSIGDAIRTPNLEQIEEGLTRRKPVRDKFCKGRAATDDQPFGRDA